MKKISFLIGVLSLMLFSCKRKKMHADFIVRNAKVYTVDGGFAVLQSFAVKDGKFVAVGTDSSIAVVYEADSTLDAKGKTILPGLIDAHCHFVNYGLGLQQCDLVGTKSWDEVVQRVKKYAATNKQQWIIGRGWDQNDWKVKEFPTKDLLDSLFPNTPVFLKRVDGHAAIANKRALDLAKINDSTSVSGGEIIKVIDETKIVYINHRKTEITVAAHLTGVLVDNAVDLVEAVIPQPDQNTIHDALLTAQQNCFAVGLTTVDDAGLMKDKIDLIDAMQQKGELKMRIYAMISDSTPNYEYYLAHGPYKTDFLDVRAFKFYADGALGSRGACLLQPYSDKTGWKGFLLNSPAHYEQKMKLLVQKKFQVCTHCIGDSANRFILHLYAKLLPDSTAKDFRWRIEHAQVVATTDVPLFGRYGIIPSVQTTHATSDMYWAGSRLGPQRITTAYAYNDLLKSAGMLALGTDFPVEDINPMYTFYAAVARKDLSGYPADGFQMNNALDRRSTLMGMTTWAAYSNFEEDEKGSIAAGKFADFVILDNDPMTCEVNAIPKIKVTATYIAGKKVF